MGIQTAIKAETSAPVMKPAVMGHRVRDAALDFVFCRFIAPPHVSAISTDVTPSNNDAYSSFEQILPCRQCHGLKVRLSGAGCGRGCA
jgi:hypothetical protein